MSIFSIYRVLKGPYSPKLSTITDPFNGDQSYLSELERLVPIGMEVFSAFSDKVIMQKGKWATGLLMILKSSPSSRVSSAGLMRAINDLQKAELLAPLIRICELLGNEKLPNQIKEAQYLLDRAYGLFGIGSKALEAFQPSVSPLLGKLSFKEEAAGKLRVFAMVDVVTQSALKQLHEILFQILRNIPNDGTFDQEASFRRAQDKCSRFGCSFGYDLSAATDRLPLSIQVKILTYWFGEELADCWRKVLVERSYIVRENDYSIPPGAYSYAVGQPMGAYSS